MVLMTSCLTGLLAQSVNKGRSRSAMPGFFTALSSLSALFENLEGGSNAEEFVQWFPEGTIQQLRAVLEQVDCRVEYDKLAIHQAIAGLS